MLYNDLIDNEGRGIYTALFDSLRDSDIDKLTDTYITTSKLDARFEYENGLKECVVKSLTQACDILTAKYLAKWCKLINTFDKLDDGASSKTINGGSIETINSITAYDDEGFIDDTKSTQNDTTTQTKYSMSGVNFVMNVFKNNYVYDIINSDIRKTLFRNVYISSK